MQLEAIPTLLGVITIVLIPLVGWLGSRQIARMDADEKAGRELASKELAAVAATIKARADEGHALAVQALNELNQHKIHIAESYVSISRFEGFEKALFSKLDTIEAKIDRKVDKPVGGD